MDLTSYNKCYLELSYDDKKHVDGILSSTVLGNSN